MVVRSFDGRIAISGKEVALAIPNTGEARYEVSGGAMGGRLDILIPEGETGGGQVVLLVPDGEGEFDELVVTEPRTLVVGEDGSVKLTLSEYVQVGNALSGVGVKLVEFEGRLAALEHPLAVYDGCDAAVPPKQDGWVGNPDSAMEGSRGPLPTYPAGEEG